MAKENDGSNSSQLSKYLSPLGAWALALGCSVGWGAFVMPGTTFLPMAGPIGTVIGMLVGGIIMLLIGINYHYMMNCYPDSGGTYAYAKDELGYDQGFLSAWFLILVYMAIVWANATAIPLIFKKIFLGVLEFGPHYTVAGFEVYLTEALLASCMIIVAGIICLRGGKLVSWLMIFLAFLLVGGVIICAVGIFVASPDVLTQMTPGFVPDKNCIGQVLRIAALAPWAYVGFESISHSTEEFSFSTKKTIGILGWALVAGMAAYSLLALIAASAPAEGAEGWIDYIGNLDKYSGLEGFPTFNAATKYMGKAGFVILGLAVGAGVLTGLVGNMLAASRLIYTLSRDRLFSDWLGALSKRKIPYRAILLLTAFSIPIPFFGRTAISWIVDVNTIGATVAYAYTSITAFKRAKKENNFGIKVTGIIGIFISVLFTLYFLVPNFLSVEALSPASYMILIAWSILGFIMFYYVFKRDKETRFGHSTIVWLVLLFLVFFITMLWFREVTHHSTEKVLNEMYDHDLEILSEKDVVLDMKESNEEKQLLQDKLSEVNDTMLRNSVIQMLIFLVALVIMLQIYSSMSKRERHMEVQKIKAEENSRAKSIFLSNMSHDIRTPMNAIIGYTELTREIKDLPPEAVENLEKIDYSSRHLLSLINDVLDMSRIESGKMELELFPSDLVQTVKEVQTIFEPQMKDKRINFLVDTSDIADRYVLCDANRLNRVLLNLISNAFKFTPEGGTIKVFLRQTEKAENSGWYRIEVQDTGVGMSKEFADKVFDAYSREKSASKVQGTGLGMAITKNIVELMHGTIRVESEKEVGTTFIVDVEFETSTKDAYNAEHRYEDKVEELDYSNINVLVVDDVMVNREIASKVLKKFGFKVEVAENGRVAVDRVTSSEPGEIDLVLMDIQMPVMNGYEAAREIREIADSQLSAIPIIAMSANAFAEDVQKCRECGMNGHIAKPIEIPKMMETINEVLRG